MRVRRTRPSLRELFDAHEGRLVHKVDHYFPIYERHLGRFVGRRPRVLEIGVAQGGSLELWHRWFGRGTVTIGVDVEERSTAFRGRRRHIEIGDQGDVAFLRRVAEEHGPFDIVLDDGSHRAEHQVLLLETLWDDLAADGVLIVEDLHTDYWPSYGGGHLRPGTFIERVKPLLDDVNAHNSREESFRPTRFTETLVGIHVYDSVVVLERGDHRPYTTSMAGRPVFDTVNDLPIDDAIPADHLARIARMNRPTRRLRRALRHPGLVVRAVERRAPGRRRDVTR
ncbi:class I SAM-dependent methyltransferase [Ilumatobacter sp.]|uniref:class I SAM-dependent methyltransferase n=1 Tax=Ilumatobacter sp. TaxID=1967498 RepID=UPI003B52FC82